jgi:hypothetical protein
MKKYIISILFVILFYGCTESELDRRLITLKVGDMYPDTLCIQSRVIEANEKWTKYYFASSTAINYAPRWIVVDKNNKILSIWRAI